MITCQECAATIAAPEGETILQCCPACFDAIMRPLSDRNSPLAKEIRRLAQIGIAEIFKKEYVSYVQQ